jgi:predicted MFS family arabinose efflux permease
MSRDVNGTAAIVAATSLTSICFLPVMLTPYILGAAARDFALDPRQLGLLAASLIGGAITVMASSVFWVRKCDWRVLVVCGAGVALAGNLLACFAHHFETLLTLLLLASCGSGVVYAPAICALSDTRYPDRNFAYSFFLQIVLSGVAGFAITAFTQPSGLPGVLGLIAVCFAMALMLAWWMPAGGVKNGTVRVASRGTTDSRVWAGLVGMLLLNGGPMAVWAFFERIGAAAGFSEHSVGNALAVGLLMGAPGALFTSMAGNRFGRAAPLIVSTLAMVATFYVAVTTRNFTIYLLAGLIFQFLFNFGMAFQYGAVSIADVSGRLIVLGPTFQGLGGMAGPAIAGMLVRGNSYAPVAAVGGLFVIVGLLLILWLCRALPSNAGVNIGVPPNR